MPGFTGNLQPLSVSDHKVCEGGNFESEALATSPHRGAARGGCACHVALQWTFRNVQLALSLS